MVFYIPNILSVVVIAAIFNAIYDPSRGLLNSIIALFTNVKDNPILWLGDKQLVIYSLAGALVWQAMEQMRREGRTLSLTQISAVGNLLRMISMIAPANNPVVAGGTARQYCEKAKWYLEGRFDRDVSVQETADFVGLSRSQLYRVMMEQLGCSPRRLLAEIRIRHAQQLLKTTSLTMEEIARRIGLCTGAQFGTLFRSMQGISPGKYRQQEREKEAAPQRLER